jgi:endonuclease-3
MKRTGKMPVPLQCRHIPVFIFPQCDNITLMPRENTAAKIARTQKIISVLKRVYPNAHCELNFSSPLELLIATILSAQCTDTRVNLVTAELFKKYRSAKDFSGADISALEKDIRSTGFYKNKAKNIKACCATLVEKFGGEVPRTMDELHSLAGVGRKTANVVLGNAFNINVGVVVDTHVTRLGNRLGLVKGTDAVKLEQDFIKLVPQHEWTDFSHWLIWHGRRRCYARKPDCAHCEILELCPRIGVKEKLNDV